MHEIDTTLQFAQRLDADDPLRVYRDQFWIPPTAEGQPQVYLVGHSLGLQPKQTAAYIEEELAGWRKRGVRGHFDSARPWVSYQECLSEPMASIVGGMSEEVILMNGLTVNLHLMMATFYRPTVTRHKILIEEHAFPSDRYAVQSQLRHHGRHPDESLILARPRAGQATLCTSALCELIEHHGESLAVVLLPGIQYFTGQALELPRIAEVAHQNGVIVGTDLAHAAGNIPLSLHDWEIDFAVWCSYKYLNSGPGSVAGCFLHERHARNVDLPRLAGWWGQDQQSRFLMQDSFQPTPTAEGWQLSNPPILSLAAIRSSLDVFQAVGGMLPLRVKSIKLTGYLQRLLDLHLGAVVDLVTPRDADARGCQLSLRLRRPPQVAKSIYERLLSMGFATDWREPDVIRAAPVPLYNSFEDVFRFVDQLREVIGETT